MAFKKGSGFVVLREVINTQKFKQLYGWRKRSKDINSWCIL